jgi:hypothetical protein
LNARRSTEAELVGVNDMMSMVLWKRHFLEAQQSNVTANVVSPVNDSAILLGKKREAIIV